MRPWSAEGCSLITESGACGNSLWRPVLVLLQGLSAPLSPVELQVRLSPACLSLIPGAFYPFTGVLKSYVV